MATKKVINGVVCVYVHGMWIDEKKAPARRAFFESVRENQLVREEKAERDIMERCARTGESPSEIRREMRTEMHAAMEAAGFGVRHRAI